MNNDELITADVDAQVIEPPPDEPTDAPAETPENPE